MGLSVLWDNESWSFDTLTKLIDDRGGRRILAYFKVEDKEVLWKRVQDRKGSRGKLRGERDGDGTFEVTKEVLDGFWEGFEEPHGEGE